MASRACAIRCRLLLTSVLLSLAVTNSSALSFNATDYTVGENDGSISLCLKVNDSLTENDALSQLMYTVTVFTLPESAEEGVDFVPLNQTFNLNVSDGCLQVDITIMDDSIFENDETFIIVAAYGDVTAPNASARITVLDDEVVQISFMAPDRVSESTGYLSVCAALWVPTDGIARGVDVTGTLDLINSNTEATENEILIFASNLTTICHNFTLDDNSVFEENSLAIVSLSSVQPRVEILNESVEVIIEDDDDLVFQLINAENVILTEGGPSNQGVLSFNLSLIGNQTIGQNYSIVINTTSDTAVYGEDYLAEVVHTTFTPAAAVGTAPVQVQVHINITIIDDNQGEPLERFRVIITSPDARVSILGGGITVTIKDNEIVQGILPMNFEGTEIQSRNITFLWNPPMTNISIIGYTIGCDGRPLMNVSDTNATLSDLTPFTNYNCFVYTRVEGNMGQDSTITIRSDEEIPGDAPEIREVNKTFEAIMFTWTPPTNSYGIITHYTLTINGSRTETVTDPLFTLSPLSPFELVTVKISATNSKGMGPFSRPMDFRSAESTPDPVSDLSAASGGDGQTLTLTWSKPTRPNGIILNYSISVYEVRRDCNDRGMRNESRLVNATSHNLRLAAGKPFLILVSAINSANSSNATSVCTFTQQGVPESPKLLNVSGLPSDESQSVNVTWMNLTLAEARGWITNYTVHYWDVATETRSTAHNSSASSDKTSLVIDGLDVFRTYNIVLTASTVMGAGTDSTVFVLKGRQRPIQSALIGGVVSILVLIIIVTVVAIILVIIRFRRRVFRHRSATLNMTKLHPGSIPLDSYHPYSSHNGSYLTESEVSSDIPVYEFSEYVKRMHKDSNHLFEQQYRSIRDAGYKHDVAFLPCNYDTKNRFIDIYPYDENRVILKKTGREGSDYINASWIDGYQRKNAYIAAQGPLEETIDDFWRMISENELSTIVMVTRLIEGPKMIDKCKQYWPTSVGHSMKFPRTNMVVTLKESKPFADYSINVLILKRPHGADLEVTQFFYQGWPDHGVPQYATSILGFLRHVRRKHPATHAKPLLVHCSAGVGRTGTFITLDVMLQKIREEQCINVHQFVKELRKGRVQMVQTESQYVFIHDALNEYVTSGDTETAVANLRIALGKLYQNDSAGFRRQYKLLSEVSRKPNEGDFEAANSEIHQHKNRFPEKIPYRDNGLKLKPNAVLGGEYINATFINGYKCVNGFVAAQAPLASTTEAFWRMVWENRCPTIVVLCDVESESSCVRFWPLSGSETYGKLQVSVSSKATEKNDVVKRQFDVNFDKRMTVANGEKLSVTLFQHTEWNEDGEQPSCKSILDLNNDVIRAQISTGNKPIVVVCNDGCGRTGTFLTIYSQIERLKTEQVIDVFQWIKSARIQRAWLVSNQEQYELIYNVLAEFIDSFDTYANFKVDNELL